MGLFDIFKKRKTATTFPENELERCLMDIATSASKQKEFFQKLLWSELFVMEIAPPGMEDGLHPPEENTRALLMTLEGGQIPIFTSGNRIFDQGVLNKGVLYMTFRGQDLFEMTKGASFVLNPYSDHGREFPPETIEALLDGSIYEKIDEYEAEERRIAEFVEIYERASKRQEKLIYLDGYKIKDVKPAEKLALEESIADFQKCLEMVPNHWQSMVLLARALQRLRRHAEALQLLESACKIELDNHTIPMEASTEAVHMKDVDKALYYSTEALRRAPKDSATMGNHAMNLLLAHRDIEAQETIEEALRLQPDDSVNRHIESIVNGVLSGERERPTFEELVK
ncbi:SseB family protein [Sphingobacterium sp. SYP-B4668]|uniref:SseB family protein n=1 Tax=Sphingobacterium sp. SYP-B4668 TaxID=2996035 RepID=UPI0022DD19A5|nr:SseB family protein [Sphingobacterium sp. SYP-B4668]